MFNPLLVHEYLTLSAKKFPQKTALIINDEKITYKKLDILSTQFANSIRGLGFERHDRGIIFLDNSIESVIAMYGIMITGGIFIMLSPTIKAAKLNYIIKDSGASLLISSASKADVINAAFGDVNDCCRLIWLDNPEQISNILLKNSYLWKDILNVLKQPVFEDSLPPLRIIDYDLAALIYTSGSTGEPKGVMSSHMNMISAARSIITYLENVEDDIILNILPLSFDYGLYQIIMSIMFGGTVLIEQSFIFPSKILQKIEKEKVTGFPLVPTIVAILLNINDLKKYDLSSLRYFTNTGAALPVEHIKILRELFPNVKIYSMFGLTECKRIAYLPPEEIDERTGSVGKAMPNCEVFVVDGDGNEVKNGVTGELVVRGSNVMRGYWNAPELTAKVYRNGKVLGEKLLFTGDLFRKDEDNFLYFVGRKDDMIKTKGERVSPKEIENMLHNLPGVREAAVIGVPDEISGQAIKAYIVAKNNYNFDAKTVMKFCSENLEIFMVPKYVEFVAELPKNSNGKIDKKVLKELNEILV